jgi:hypothetical protein
MRDWMLNRLVWTCQGRLIRYSSDENKSVTKHCSENRQHELSLTVYESKGLAERVGFEPTIPVKVYTLSKRAPSATRPSLRTKTGWKRTTTRGRSREFPRTAYHRKFATSIIISDGAPVLRFSCELEPTVGLTAPHWLKYPLLCT